MYLINLEKCLRLFDKVYVSTDDQEIANVVKKKGAIPIMRGEELCGDCPNIPVYQHAATKIRNFDGIIAVQANSPLIDTFVLETVKRVLEEGGRDEVMTCHEGGSIYGSVWGISFKKLKNYGDPYDPHPDVMVVDTSIDIHDERDYNEVLEQYKIYGGR